MILIGSRALALRCPQALSRKPLDFDFICTQAEFETWMEKNSAKVNPTKVYPLPEYNKMIVEGKTICEFEIIQPGSSNELLVDLTDKEWIETPFGYVPPLDLLFSIKDSHRFKKFHLNAAGFWKTAMDWHAMKHLGAIVRPKYQEFSKLRQKESYAGQRHPKLNVSKDNFFKDDGLQDTYIYDHDDLHRAVMKHDRPAYEFYLTPGEEVKCSKDIFFSVSEDIRLHGVVQEGCTLGLERSLIPHKNAWTPDFAFKFALAKISSSIASGFFREYSFSHIPQVLRLYDEQYRDYYDRFQQALSDGKVKLFTGKQY